MRLTILQNNAVVQLWEQCSDINPNSLHPYENLIINVASTNDQAIELMNWLVGERIVTKAEVIGETSIRCSVDVEKLKKYVP